MSVSFEEAKALAQLHGFSLTEGKISNNLGSCKISLSIGFTIAHICETPSKDYSFDVWEGYIRKNKDIDIRSFDFLFLSLRLAVGFYEPHKRGIDSQGVRLSSLTPGNMKNILELFRAWARQHEQVLGD